MLPFVLLFYGEASEYIWGDDSGKVHLIQQGEGGEQGDALMSLLYALGQHRALKAISEQLLPSERLFAFLDDLYVVAAPGRICAIFEIMVKALWDHARIRVHGGKTTTWNRNGTKPPNIETQRG